MEPAQRARARCTLVQDKCACACAAAPSAERYRTHTWHRCAKCAFRAHGNFASARRNKWPMTIRRISKSWLREEAAEAAARLGEPYGPPEQAAPRWLSVHITPAGWVGWHQACAACKRCDGERSGKR